MQLMQNSTADFTAKIADFEGQIQEINQQLTDRKDTVEFTDNLVNDQTCAWNCGVIRGVWNQVRFGIEKGIIFGFGRATKCLH